MPDELDDNKISEITDSYVDKSNSKLTKALLMKVAMHTEQGKLDVQIYRACNIKRSTWFFWKRGAKELVKDLASGEKSFDSLDGHQRNLLTLLDFLSRNDDALEDRHYSNVDDAAMGLGKYERPEYRASCWILERKFPQIYSKKTAENTKVTVTNKETGQDVVVEVTKVEIEEKQVEIRELF